MTAAEVAAAIAEGLRDGGRNAEELPVADGGEGTADALVRALGGEWMEADASDALGRPIRGRFAMLDGRVAQNGRPSVQKRTLAVVEAAEASGLARISESERDAFAASSRGTGDLIVAAVEAGASHVLVAVGGTASTDAGTGALAALDEAAVDPQLT